jgi:S1-C subfamily serine protease
VAAAPTASASVAVAAAPTATVPAPATAAVAAPARVASAKHADGAAALAAALTGEDVAPTAPVAGATVLARADVSAALSNFAALSKTIQGAFTADGLRIDAVTAGSVFAKAGLLAGDIVTSVDGKPLRSLDDAADVYARAGKARSMNAQVLRGGTSVALRVAIQ